MLVMQRFVDIAAQQAAKSTFRQRLGTVVLDGREITGRGHNKVKTHPRLVQYGHYAIHAECDALLRAASGDTLVVVRVSKRGKLVCSKPCAKCMKFIKAYGIKTVYYIDWDGSTQELTV